jgi:hypothetical protein
MKDVTLHILLGLCEFRQTFCLIRETNNSELIDDLATVYEQTMDKGELDLAPEGWGHWQTYLRYEEVTARMEIRSSNSHIDYCVWVKGSPSARTVSTNCYGGSSLEVRLVV